MSNKGHFIAFGPKISIVPHKDFDQIPEELASRLDGLWQICGPTVEKNLFLRRPMWEIITIAYLEGLNHATGVLARYESDRESRQPAGDRDRGYPSQDQIRIFVEGQLKTFQST